MRRILGILAILTVLTACGGTTGSTDDDPPSGSNADTSSEAEAPESAQPEAANPTFGKSYTWDNGLTVTVSKPTKFKAGEYAAGAEGQGTSLRFTVTVVNKTGAPYDPVGDYISVQSGNAEAEQIFDGENGLNGSPSTKLLDGREAKYDVGFHVAKPNDLVMEFQPADFNLDSAVFTGGS